MPNRMSSKFPFMIVAVAVLCAVSMPSARAAIIGDVLTTFTSNGHRFAVEAQGDAITFSTWASDVDALSPATAHGAPVNAWSTAERQALFSQAGALTGNAGGSITLWGDSATPSTCWYISVASNGSIGGANTFTFNGSLALLPDYVFYLGPVPEPTSLALLGLGCVALVRRRRA